MDKYDKLKNTIDKYFNLEDFISNDEQINAYELYKELNNRFSLIKIYEEKLIKIMNKYRLKENLMSTFSRNAMFFKCDSVMFTCTNDRLEIVFYFTLGNLHTKICKDKDSNQLYFDNDAILDNKFINKYYDIIMQTFQILEYFDNILQGNIGEKIIQKFTDDFLDIIIQYNGYDGDVKINIEINDNVDPEKLYNRKWYNRQSLNDYLNENKEKILKKVPISIDELDYTCKKIIEEKNSNNMEIPKVLSIGKK